MIHLLWTTLTPCTSEQTDPPPHVFPTHLINKEPITNLPTDQLTQGIPENSHRLLAPGSKACLYFEMNKHIIIKVIAKVKAQSKRKVKALYSSPPPPLQLDVQNARSCHKRRGTSCISCIYTDNIADDGLMIWTCECWGEVWNVNLQNATVCGHKRHVDDMDFIH